MDCVADNSIVPYISSNLNLRQTINLVSWGERPQIETHTNVTRTNFSVQMFDKFLLSHKNANYLHQKILELASENAALEWNGKGFVLKNVQILSLPRPCPCISQFMSIYVNARCVRLMLLSLYCQYMAT